MKNLRLIGFTTAALFAASAAVLAACSSDTTVSASGDGGGQPEGSTFEAGTDSGGKDAGPDSMTDAAPDGSEVDAGLSLVNFADHRPFDIRAGRVGDMSGNNGMMG